jgi:hypothetical protein
MAMAIIVMTGPASEYELSIYSAFPLYLWPLIALPMTVPLISAIVRERSFGLLVFLQVSCAITALFAFLSLAFFRGYSFYNPNDSLTHLGFVLDIERTGQIGAQNFYPGTHILIFSISELSSSDLKDTMLLFPQFFSCLFVAWIYVLLRALGSDTRKSLFAVSFAFLPLLGGESISVFPSTEGFFLIPLMLFLFLKSTSRKTPYVVSYSLSLLLLLIVLPIMNPEPTMFLLVMFIICYYVARTVSKRSSISNMRFWKQPTTMVKPILILTTAFVAWFSSSIIFDLTVKRAYASLVLGTGRSTISEYSSILGRANVQALEFGELVVILYGVALIFGCIGAAVSVKRIANAAAKKKTNPNELFLSWSYWGLAPLMALFLLKDFLIGPRPMKYLLLISMILTGLGISQWVLSARKNDFRRMYMRFLVALIIFLAVMGISFNSTYPSPRIYLPNYQVTQAEFGGMGFYFEYRNNDTNTLEITISQWRYAQAFYGVEEIQPNIRYGTATLPVDHFGYEKNMSLGDSYHENQYLIFNSLTWLYPSVVSNHPQVLRFTAEELGRTGMDQTINQVFDNGNIELFLVEATGR